MTNRIQGNLQVDGRISSTHLDVPAQTITDAAISATAGIAAGKLQHQHQPVVAQPIGLAAADETRVIHVVRGTAGQAYAFAAGCVVANVGDSKVEVDLLKNGASILSAKIEINSGHANRAVVAGTIPSGTLAAGDVLEVAIDATVGTGTLGQGTFAVLTVRESAD